MDNWHVAPPAFNPDFRAGIGKAVSAEYTEYCEENPDKTQEDRKAEYQRIYARLLPKFPSVRELSQR
jgi:hypothetical protein